jgi:hypothetical protein
MLTGGFFLSAVLFGNGMACPALTDFICFFVIFLLGVFITIDLNFGAYSVYRLITPAWFGFSASSFFVFNNGE